MLVVDTSAWIEVLIGTATGKRVKDVLPRPDEWIVPTIVQMELAKWTQRELDTGMAEAIVAFSTQCLVIELDTPLALAAADISRTHRLPTADAIVYATAQAMAAELLTCDAHFRDLPGVRLIAKDAA
jgi:predicted nucleic acid-binding protein